MPPTTSLALSIAVHRNKSAGGTINQYASLIARLARLPEDAFPADEDVALLSDLCATLELDNLRADQDVAAIRHYVRQRDIYDQAKTAAEADGLDAAALAAEYDRLTRDLRAVLDEANKQRRAVLAQLTAAQGIDAAVERARVDMATARGRLTFPLPESES